MATNVNNTEGCARYIGRVGALAVALGIGVAVATGQGVASAAEDGATDGSSATSSSGSTDSSESGGDATAPSTGTASEPDPPGAAPESTSPSAASDTPKSSSTTDASPPPAGAASSSPTEQTLSPDPDVVIRSSGGAVTSGQPESSSEERKASHAPPKSADPPPAYSAPESQNEQSAAPVVHAKSVVAPDPSPEVDKTADHTVDAPSLSVAAVTTGPTTNAARMTSFAALAPTPPPPNPVTAFLAVPTAIVDTVTNVVTAVLSGFVTPAPGAPANPPLLWAVLAIVRREFFNQTPTITATASKPDALGNITISLNERDVDGDALLYSATDGAKGSVTLNPDGHSFTYTPKAGETGTDTVTISASDDTSPHVHGPAGLLNALSFGLFGDAGHDAVQTTITVKLNTPPTLTVSPGTPDPTTGKVTVTLVTTDDDGDPPKLSVTQPANGSASDPVLVDAATGTYAVTYTPTDEARHDAAADTATAADGSDSFTVTVDDEHGAKVTRTVDVAIAPDNDAPTFSKIDNLSTDAAGKVTGTVVFTDTDQDTLIYSGTGNTGKGSVVVNADGTFAYTPKSDERFVATATEGDDTDTFTVTVNDQHGATMTRTVTVTILPAAITSNPTAALAAAEKVVSSRLQSMTAARTDLSTAVASIGSISPAVLDVAAAQVMAQAKALDAARADGDVQNVADLRSAMESLLGTISDAELALLITKAKALDAAESAVDKPLETASDARAVIATNTAADGKPVFVRVEDYKVAPNGTATGRLVFYNPENQPLTIQGGSIVNAVPAPGNVAIGQFAALPADQFRYAPNAFGVAATSVTFLVFFGDADDPVNAVNVTIDVTRPTANTVTEAAKAVVDVQDDLGTKAAQRQTALAADKPDQVATLDALIAAANEALQARQAALDEALRADVFQP